MPKNSSLLTIKMRIFTTDTVCPSYHFVTNLPHLLYNYVTIDLLLKVIKIIQARKRLLKLTPFGRLKNCTQRLVPAEAGNAKSEKKCNET